MGTINDFIRKLERFQTEVGNLSGKTVGIVPDAKGMIDKQCPKKECHAQFKINASDWKNIVKDEEVFCPHCRNKSVAKEYLPSEQKRKIVTSVRNAIMDNWKHNIPINNNIASIKSQEEFEFQKMNEEHKKVIYEIANKKFPKAKIFETQMNMEEFKLDFIPIFR